MELSSVWKETMIVIHKEDRTTSFSNLRKREEETERREAAATGRMGSSHLNQQQQKSTVTEHERCAVTVSQSTSKELKAPEKFYGG